MISTFDSASLIKTTKRSAQARIIRDSVAIIKTYAKRLHKTKRQAMILDALFLTIQDVWIKLLLFGITEIAV